MRTRVFHLMAVVVGTLAFANTAAHASPVGMREIVQVLSGSQSAVEIQLQIASQGSSTTRSTANSSGSQSSSSAFAESLLSGIVISSDDSLAGVHEGDLADVEGTICDCGDFFLPGDGFLKWPTLFLAAVPFFFIPDCDHCESDTPMPLPTPNSTPPPGVPEPASFVLLSSGLAAFAAGLRRRQNRTARAAKSTKEG